MYRKLAINLYAIFNIHYSFVITVIKRHSKGLLSIQCTFLFNRYCRFRTSFPRRSSALQYSEMMEQCLDLINYYQFEILISQCNHGRQARPCGDDSCRICRSCSTTAHSQADILLHYQADPKPRKALKITSQYLQISIGREGMWPFFLK